MALRTARQAIACGFGANRRHLLDLDASIRLTFPSGRKAEKFLQGFCDLLRRDRDSPEDQKKEQRRHQATTPSGVTLRPIDLMPLGGGGAPERLPSDVLPSG